MRNFLALSVLALATGLAAAQTPAPAPAAAPAAPQGGGGMAQQAPKQTIDLATAKKMIAAAEAAAAALNQHIAICVMDTNGDVVLAERMDGTPHVPIITAQGKARAVLMFGVPTSVIAQATADKKPVTATVKAPPIGYGGEINFFRGGLPIFKDGVLIGAIGAGGSASESDEKFAQAGIDAITAK
jgi:glc operon protein GlcG